MKAIIDAQEFKRIIDNTKRFAGGPEKEALMQYIYLEVDAEEKSITATAMDGYRISVEYADILDADTSFKCFIKEKIPKITRWDANAELELSNNRLYVQVGMSIMGYVQPEGTYYDIKKMLNKYMESKPLRTIGVNAKFLKEALESIEKSYTGRSIAKIDIRNPKDAVIIRSGKRGKRENIKFVLPVNLRNNE